MSFKTELSDLNLYKDEDGTIVITGNTVGNSEELTLLKESFVELRADYDAVKSLLAQVRDALNNGDIDEAINLLDTFLLDGGVLA